VRAAAGAARPAAETALEGRAAVPSRTLALAVPAVLAAGGYLVNGLHGIADWLDPVRFASSFWLVGSSPLQDGARGVGVVVVVVLLAAAAALVAGALLVERRDLRTS
jgi:ABC-2 type transport system permease protein